MVTFEKVASRLISIVLAITAVLIMQACWAYAQCDADFEVPQPPDSELSDTKSFALGGRSVETLLYKSKAQPNAIVNFYRNFFQGEGFGIVLDTKEEEQSKCLLRVKRDDLVVNIATLVKPDGTDVVVARYTEQPGMPPPEQFDLSVKDPMVALPTEDVEGSDIDDIPRPPDSVRCASDIQETQAMLSYSTVLPIEEARDFYKLNMPSEGWQLVDERAAGDLANQYMQATKEPSLGSRLAVKGLDIDSVIQRSYILRFRDGLRQAQIVILPDFTREGEEGAIIEVLYNTVSSSAQY